MPDDKIRAHLVCQLPPCVAGENRGVFRNLIKNRVRNARRVEQWKQIVQRPERLALERPVTISA